MKNAHDAGKKGSKRTNELYHGLQQAKCSIKGGTVTSLRHGSVWRSNLAKKYFGKLTKAQLKAHTAPARKALAKAVAARRKRKEDSEREQ